MKKQTNILVIAWDRNNNILKSSAFRDENAATTQAKEYLDGGDEPAHVVLYYAKFKPGDQPETILIPYSWFEEE